MPRLGSVSSRKIITKWGFDTPQGKIKYTITIHSGNLWNEIGEFSRDKGVTWMKFFEMNRKKEN